MATNTLGTVIIDHAGEVLADAGGDGEAQTLRATLGRENMMSFRQKLPFLNDADRFGVR